MNLSERIVKSFIWWQPVYWPGKINLVDTHRGGRLDTGRRHRTRVAVTATDDALEREDVQLSMADYTIHCETDIGVRPTRLVHACDCQNGPTRKRDCTQLSNDIRVHTRILSADKNVANFNICIRWPANREINTRTTYVQFKLLLHAIESLWLFLLDTLDAELIY